MSQPPYGQQPQGNGQQPPGYYGDKQSIGQPRQPAVAYEHAPNLPNKFQFGLFDCLSPLSTCCLSCWCPCILFGKTHAREHGDRDSSGINGMCFAHCLLLCCGISPILQCIRRGKMQDKYGMETNLCTNCLVAFCCGCCQLVQEEKESVVRGTGVDPKTDQTYQPPTGMGYP